MSRKFIVTGGPGTGKTSVIKELEKEFRVFHEVARDVLKNKEFSEEVQYEIFKKQLQQLKEADNLKGIVFFDRNIVDSLAYLKVHNLKISPEILEAVKKENTGFEAVFLLDFVPYVTDDIRKETEEEAKRVHKIIYGTYSDLDYEIIKVALMSVEERVNYIKSKINI